MSADTLGGVWSYCVELARALDRFHIRILIAAMGAPMSRSQRNEIESLANVEVLDSNFKLEWMSEPWSDVAQAGEWLLRIESDWRPAIIHLNGYTHASLEWRAPAVVVAHSCVLSWWRGVHGVEAPPEWSSYRDAVMRGLAAADAVVAPSQAMLVALCALYGKPRRSCVIYNSRTPALFRVENKREYVFAAGRVWDQAKNFSLLDKIAASLPWKVYLAGALAQPGSSGGRLPNLTHLGNLPSERMRDWLAFASVLVHPARYEPFGLAPLEAALSGCALVLSDIPSLRELWEGAAIFVSPENPDMLRESISLLISCPGLRSELQNAAYRRALMLSPERMAESYIQLYEHLLQRRFGLGRPACV